ncbi:hypothetical protein KY289_021398 [Solanum tuberosum]|nr:hypothetical protein KY289_021398 [Solanum tuberosum]
MGTPAAKTVLPSERSSTLNEQHSHVMRIDIHHPYFLHNSDSPRMNLITSTFDGKGFLGWRRSILIALSAKKKLGFINGTYTAPDPQNPQFAQWSCCNDMVISWLLNSLTKEITDSVIYSKTAKELWDSLEHRFGRTNGAKLYHLQKELSGTIQGNSDIVGYFIKLKRLWDELDALKIMICCSCDENQRETYAHNSFSNNDMGFMANSQGRNFQRSCNFVSKRNFSQDNFAPQKNSIPNQRGGRGNYKNKGRRNKRIGYPDDFEFTKSKDFYPSKPKGFQGRANGAFPSEDNSEIQGMTQQQGTPSNIFYQLNKEQYVALVLQSTCALTLNFSLI